MEKVIIALMMNEYGDPKQGPSYANYNFLNVLKSMPGFSTESFDYWEALQAHGKRGMNKQFIELVQSEMPDITIVLPFRDEFEPETIRAAGAIAPIIAYFFDDMWRTEYSRFWAKYYTYVTTSDIHGIAKFAAAGLHNVVYSPFACNLNVFKNLSLPKVFDVSFVGQYHPYRAWIINLLKRAKISVNAFGAGWPAGRVGEGEMVRIFNQSRLNLNLSNCVCWDARYVVSSYGALKDTFRSTLKRESKNREQVKGRHFEINACAGTQISYFVEGLERCYSIGEEIVIFSSPDELIEKIRYYLRYYDEARAIAEKGFQRTLADHSMEQRFRALFDYALKQ